MKKKKVYLGKRGLNHTEGVRNGKFVLPRMFREYYRVRRLLHVANVALKMQINSTCGAKLGHPSDNDDYDNLLYRRRLVVKALDKHVGITRMREVLSQIQPSEPKEIVV